MWWRRMGFERNPYFGDELDASEFSSNLFVGRKEEARSLLIDIAEDGRALACIGGISGCGKTSFINHCQCVALRKNFVGDLPLPRIIPCITKVQLHEGEDYALVLLKVLSSLVASVLSVCDEFEHPVPALVIDLKETIDSTVSGGSGWGVGASAWGFGATLNQSDSTSHSDSPLIREVSLVKKIEEVLALAKEELEFDGIGIVINNLETLSEGYLVSFLNYGRDSIFSLHGAWWYLSGIQQLGRFVESKVPRLRGYLSGTGVDIVPLSVADLSELLELRRKEYALQEEVALPISQPVVELLYKSSSGDLRFLFNICANVVRRAIKEMPSVNINEEIAIQIVAILTRENLSYYLETQPAGKVMRELLVSQVESFTSQDFRRYGYDAVEAFERDLAILVKEHYLWLDVGQIGPKSYEPRGYLQLGILSDVGSVLR